MEKPRLIAVGKIVKPHGVAGAVKAYAYGESLTLQKAGDKLIARSPEGGGERELTVVGVKAQGKLWVVRFEELSSMDDAQGARGEELFLPEDRLPPASEGEYYHYRLIGLNVETVEGKAIGVLRGIIETGGNDVYVVESEGKEVLIPAVDDVIRLVDLDKGRMAVDLPDGLMDDL